VEKKMFVWAALDESTDRFQKHAYVVAGLLSAQQNWSNIERAWNKRLARDGLKYFKTSEYLLLKGEFAKFKDKYLYPHPAGREAAKEIFSDLALILKSENHIGLSIALNLADYRKVRKGVRAQKILPVNPYRLMYQIAMVAIAVHMSQCENPQMIAFLCDEHSKAKQLADSYSSIKEANPHAAEYMGSLTFGNDSQWAAIQAADLVAGVSKDYFVKYFDGKILDEVVATQKLQAEIGTHIGFSYIDEIALKKLVGGNILHRGRPSIRSTKQAVLFNDLFRIS